MKEKLLMFLILSTLAVTMTLGLMIRNEETPIKEVIAEEIVEVEPEVEEVIVEEKQEDNLVYLGEFLLTGYCDCEICQEEWVGTTALGIAPEPEWTIAVDPDIIPLGSHVWINGHRYYACDVGGMINEKHIDIFCSSHEECYSDFCNGYADVYLEIE